MVPSYSTVGVLLHTQQTIGGRKRAHGGISENRKRTRYDCSALRVVKFMLYSER